ncbi:MAG: methionyl-tRNA formyltransferase, partial [Candidatus Margulisiibacteriota bacterium]
LLPKYRGAAPIQWALSNGEKETGMTIFKLVKELDAGPVIAQEKIRILDEDTMTTLLKKLFSLGGEMLLATLKLIEDGKAQYLPQDEKQATFAPIISKEMGVVIWEKKAEEISNLIRALNPWPGVATCYRGKKLKMLRSQKVEGSGRPGEIINILKDQGIVIAAGDGALLITEVQLEGGKAMSAKDFLAGHDVKIGETLPN